MADIDVDDLGDRTVAAPRGVEPRLCCPTALMFVPTQDTRELARTYTCTVTRDGYYATIPAVGS